MKIWMAVCLPVLLIVSFGSSRGSYENKSLLGRARNKEDGFMTYRGEDGSDDRREGGGGRKRALTNITDTPQRTLLLLDSC